MVNKRSGEPFRAGPKIQRRRQGHPGSAFAEQRSVLETSQKPHIYHGAFHDSPLLCPMNTISPPFIDHYDLPLCTRPSFLTAAIFVPLFHPGPSRAPMSLLPDHARVSPRMENSPTDLTRRMRRFRRNPWNGTEN